VFPPAHLVLEAPQQILAACVAQREQRCQIAVAVIRREVVDRSIVHEKVEDARHTPQLRYIIYDQRCARPGGGGPAARLLNRRAGEIHRRDRESILGKVDGVGARAAAQVYRPARLDTPVLH
jgi:hypothetical protein